MYKFPAEGAHYVCSTTSQQQVKAMKQYLGHIHIHIHTINVDGYFSRSRWCIELTAKCSSCMLYTPGSMSNFRHCSYSHSVLSASIQSSQNSRGCRRWDWDGSCIVPRCCPISSILHLVLRDGQVTLGSGPSYSQSWCMRLHCLGQCNTIDSGGSCQKDRNAASFIGTVMMYMDACATVFLCPN